MKKVFSCLLIICAMITSVTLLTACGDEETTNDGAKTIEVSTVDQMTTALESEEEGITIKLTDNLIIEDTLRVFKKVTLDLNGMTISNTTDLWQDATEPKSWSIISIDNGGDLTITGNGTLHGKDGDCYAVDIVRSGKCTIENGTFIGNMNAVYVHRGDLIVKGGTFSIQQLWNNVTPYGYILNCYDECYRDDTANITVTGGTFAGFNPSDCNAEGEHTNFVKEGYTVTADTAGIVNYTVVKANKSDS